MTRTEEVEKASGSDHFIIGRGGWKTFWKNNLALLLAEQNNLAQPVCWTIFFALIYCKKKIIIYRIHRGAETAVYQAWLVQKNLTFISLWKKIWLQFGVWKKSSFNQLKKKSEKKSSLPPPIMKWSLSYNSKGVTRCIWAWGAGVFLK